jgi:hypothetical protein
VGELREFGEIRSMVSEELPPGFRVAKVDLVPADVDGVRKPGLEVIVDVANLSGNPNATFPGYEIAERIRRRWRPEHLFITLRVIEPHDGTARNSET